MHQLQIGQVAIAGVRMLFGHFGSAIRIAWIPLLLLVVIQVILAILILPDIEAMTADLEASSAAGGGTDVNAVEMQLVQMFAAMGWKLILISVLSGCVLATLTTGWIQHVLRGDVLRHGAGFFRFGGRELRIILAGILYGLLTTLVIAAIMAVGGGIEFATSLPSVAFVLPVGFVAYVYLLRLALVFPMISVGEGIRWRSAWQLTKGNTWRLFFALFLAGLLYFVISLAAGIAVNLTTAILSLLAPDSIALTLVLPVAAQMVISVAGFLIILGSLAEAYRQLGGPGVGISQATLAVFDDD